MTRNYHKLGFWSLLFLLVLLSACSGGSSSPSASNPSTCGSVESSAQTTTRDYSAVLLQAYVDNPGLALKIAPTSHLGTLRIPAADPSGTIIIPVADLEANYETQFCQLNSTTGVTMQSPECQANIAYISKQCGTGNFNLSASPIANNPLGVTSVKFQPVTYNTTVLLPQGEQTFNVSGGLLLPQGIAADKIKGVITYFHATAFDKSIVGSDYTTNAETQLVAEVFASQGYIVVIPDYIGQGVDWATVHPYVLYPRVSVKTALDMLTAVAPTIRTEYRLDSKALLKLFSAGYSEGGAYSLWFSSYLKEQPAQLNSLYQLKHSVGMEGAYNTSTVTKGFLFSDVAQAGTNPYNIGSQALANESKPLLSADAFLSYATYDLAGDMRSVFNMDFYNLQATPPPNIKTTFNQANDPTLMVSFTILSGAWGLSANGSTYFTFGDMSTSVHNNVNALVSPTLLSTAGQTLLDTVLRAADVNLTNLQDGAVSIISLSQDSVVTPNNYSTLLSAYPSKIRDAYMIPASSLQVISPLSSSTEYINVDHLQGLIYEFLYALNTFNQF